MKLQKWTKPQNYYGENWNEYYIFLSQNRDSQALERSNFECGLQKIGGKSETVIASYERHWACGWLETILIHESDTKALEIADKLAQKLEDYPVIDEDHFTELVHAEGEEFLNSDIWDRFNYINENGIALDDFGNEIRQDGQIVIVPESDRHLYKVMKG